jgi:plastocyanin
MTALRILTTALVAAGVLTTAATAATRAQTTPRLVGTVGKNDAFTIKLVDAKGKTVTRLKSGTYKLVVHDDSALHNYELDGPNGKSWTFTSVPFRGTKTFTLKLAAGKYKAYCAPHESSMFQRFTVG